MSIPHTSMYVEHENVENVHDDLGDIWNGPQTYNAGLNILPTGLATPTDISVTAGQNIKNLDYRMLVTNSTNNQVYALNMPLALSTSIDTAQNGVNAIGTAYTLVPIANWTSLGALPQAGTSGVLLDSGTYFDFSNAIGSVYDIHVSVLFTGLTVPTNCYVTIQPATVPAGPISNSYIAQGYGNNGTQVTTVVTANGVFAPDVYAAHTGFVVQVTASVACSTTSVGPVALTITKIA